MMEILGTLKLFTCFTSAPLIQTGVGLFASFFPKSPLLIILVINVTAAFMVSKLHSLNVNIKLICHPLYYLQIASHAQPLEQTSNDGITIEIILGFT